METLREHRKSNNPGIFLVCLYISLGPFDYSEQIVLLDVYKAIKKPREVKVHESRDAKAR